MNIRIGNMNAQKNVKCLSLEVSISGLRSKHSRREAIPMKHNSTSSHNDLHRSSYP